MPRIAKELGPLAVKGLTDAGLHPVGGVAGLMLQVSPTGTRSWLLRVKVGDKRREIGLGAFPGVTLAQAREKAQATRDDITKGIDPVAQRAAARQTIVEQQQEEKALAWTFKRCAEAYIKAKKPGWRNVKHGAQWENTLATYAYPSIGDVLVRHVDITHITNIIEPHWATKNETINRVRNRIELVLDWAAVRKLRSGDNPARWKGNLDKLLADRKIVGAVTGHRALAASDLYAFMQALKDVPGTSARCLEFVVLTACRSGEARLATWAEIDTKAKTWAIPGPRMKSGRPHSVPLSDEVMSLLEALPRLEGTDLVFPGAKEGKPLSDMSLSAVMRRMGVDAVPHGFRASFSSWCASSTAYPSEVREMALAHAIGDGTVAAYQRSDLFEKRRNLMADWAKFLDTAPGVGDNVVQMRQAAA
jgi:integrase